MLIMFDWTKPTITQKKKKQQTNNLLKDVHHNSVMVNVPDNQY